jgi:hypothetical protein
LTGISSLASRQTFAYTVKQLQEHVRDLSKKQFQALGRSKEEAQSVRVREQA